MKVTILFLFVSLIICLNSCQNKTDEINCPSRNLSNQQKEGNNLFLDFYFGMTPNEYKKEEQKLISTGVLFHSDSTTKFIIATNYEFPAKSVFIIIPSFEQCILHSINLEYIAQKNSSAVFKSYSLSSSEAKNIPDVGNVADIEKLYREKFGAPHISKISGIEEVRNQTWRIKNKGISTHSIFSESSDLKGRPYKQLSGFYIDYRNVKSDETNKFRQNSVDKVNKERTTKQAETSKNSI